MIVSKIDENSEKKLYDLGLPDLDHEMFSDDKTVICIHRILAN